ncbi:MAG: helix-turn-helix domain-containing protein, partial [Steroidobacteraceae bacterium]
MEAKAVFSPRFKLGVIERMEAGESATALSHELSIKRELLYDWQRLWRREGAGWLRRQGRPTLVEALVRGEAPPKSLAQAERKIADLERKVGQLALELDFFGRALQRIEGSRQP